MTLGWSTAAWWIQIPALVLISIATIRLWGALQRRSFLKLVPGAHRVVAFFHPYCDCGGGGERVLWVAVDALLRAHASTQPGLVIAIYTGGTCSLPHLLRLVHDQFRIDLRCYEHSPRIRLVNIKSRSLLEAKWYPVATMLGQCVGSMFVGLECLLRLSPDVYFDTTGAAFTYPIFALLGGSKVACYVHYPIISSDMLQRVREHRPAHNNHRRVAQSMAISTVKVLYYKVVASLYSLVGSVVSRALVNSTWTEGHMKAVWGTSGGGGRDFFTKVFPPCNTTELVRNVIQPSVAPPTQLASDTRTKNPFVVLSIGQFRPEKDHSLQLRAFAAFLKLRPVFRKTVKLVLLGGARHAQDDKLVSELKKEAHELGITDAVEFIVNAPFPQVQSMLASATVGIHTMWNEHFGISIVEMMAAGLVVVAHNSGGPKMDIVTPAAPASHAVGYLAASTDEYAQCLADALDMSDAAFQEMRQRARAAVSTRFSDEAFSAGILKVMGELTGAVGVSHE